jgi:hypothetical protein
VCITFDQNFNGKENNNKKQLFQFDSFTDMTIAGYHYKDINDLFFNKTKK